MVSEGTGRDSCTFVTNPLGKQRRLINLGVSRRAVKSECVRCARIALVMCTAQLPGKPIEGDVADDRDEADESQHHRGQECGPRAWIADSGKWS